MLILGEGRVREKPSFGLLSRTLSPRADRTFEISKTNWG
jgi:hypothetical protein